MKAQRDKNCWPAPKLRYAFTGKSLTRQVRIRGTVEQVSSSEADAYYGTRGRGSRIGAWASQAIAAFG